VNTSQTDALLDSSRFEDFRSFISTARNWGAAERTAIVEETRDLFNEVCSDALNAITSETLTAWLISELIDANHGMSMVINDTAAQRCYVMGHDTIRAARCLSAGYTAHLVAGKGTTSRRIVLKGNGETLDLGLRLRVTSNNGIKAFLGLSKANRNSQVVLKLQQDKVAALVADAAPQVISY
jgi:hypothetical protein